MCVVMDSDTLQTYHTPYRIQSVMIAASFVVPVIIVVVVTIFAVAVAIVVEVKALVLTGAVVNMSFKVLVCWLT